MQSKTFHVVYRNIPAAFTIDWIDGFLLKQFATVNYQFIYAFSQLKSSSDDGNATLKLEFVDPPGTRELVIQVRFMLASLYSCHGVVEIVKAK